MAVKHNIYAQLVTAAAFFPDSDHDFLRQVGQTAHGFLGDINFHLNRGDINPEVWLRSSTRYKKGPSTTREYGPQQVGVHAIAGDPAHWGHILGPMQAMARLKLDKIVYVPAANDPIRKPNMTPAEIRHPLVKALLKTFFPFFIYSRIAMDYQDDPDDNDGETNLFRLAWLNASLAVHWVYIVGDDHFRRFYPNGNPDTLVKLEEKLINRGLPPRHHLSVAFLGRTGLSEPTTLKVHSLLPVLDASSTEARGGKHRVMPYEVIRMARPLELYNVRDLTGSHNEWPLVRHRPHRRGQPPPNGGSAIFQP